MGIFILLIFHSIWVDTNRFSYLSRSTLAIVGPLNVCKLVSAVRLRQTKHLVVLTTRRLGTWGAHRRQVCFEPSQTPEIVGDAHHQMWQMEQCNTWASSLLFYLSFLFVSVSFLFSTCVDSLSFAELFVPLFPWYCGCREQWQTHLFVAVNWPFLFQWNIQSI